jgi:hypothetical protein
LFLSRSHGGTDPVSLFPVKYLEKLKMTNIRLTQKLTAKKYMKYIYIYTHTHTTSTYRKSILASWINVEGISPLRLLKLTSLHWYEIKVLRGEKRGEATE